jgi:hypothetical protein
VDCVPRPCNDPMPIPATREGGRPRTGNLVTRGIIEPTEVVGAADPERNASLNAYIDRSTHGNVAFTG